MKNGDIIYQRLINQQIGTPDYSTPGDIVSSMIAMQAQEFAMAKWAIGLRLPKSTEVVIDKAYNDGEILRTHLLRPTWHFVTPKDIRWLTTLTAPRVQAGNATMYRKAAFDRALLTRSNDTIARALEGGHQLTRPSLQQSLSRVKIKADGIALSLLMMNAELDGIICSGARVRNQFTYALMDERVPATVPFDRPDAIATLTRRYFSSRGPATLHDLVNWSSLTMKEAREGAASLPADFVEQKLNGRSYIFQPLPANKIKRLQSTFLLPDYDEYGLSYKDRTAIIPPDMIAELNKGGNSAYQHMIVVNGTIGGTWKLTKKRNGIHIKTSTFETLNKTGMRALKTAVQKYSRFVGKALTDGTHIIE